MGSHYFKPSAKVVHNSCFILQWLFILSFGYSIYHWLLDKNATCFIVALTFLNGSISFYKVRMMYNRQIMEEYNNAINKRKDLATRIGRRLRRKFGIKL